MSPSDRLQFFVTPPQPCPYLAGREATNLYADPDRLDNRLYSRLAQLGFRRSGSQVYRPACIRCSACVPVRVPVAAFRPHRRDRRCLAENADLRPEWLTAHDSPEHFALYSRYLDARHPGGGMDHTTPEQYRQFLIGDWSDTGFLEVRLAGRLVAVAVTDRLEDGLSAVYTFYDPDLGARGLGNYCILRQIKQAQALRLPYLYLGYWVADAPKMAYKGRFRPLEVLGDGGWQALD
ncbi:MAG: arginyltransferase [Gammaproteobacteria bacterium]